LLCGIRSNIEKIRPKLKAILKDIESAAKLKDYKWLWKVEPEQFQPLPRRVSVTLEKNMEVKHDYVFLLTQIWYN